MPAASLAARAARARVGPRVRLLLAALAAGVSAGLIWSDGGDAGAAATAAVPGGACPSFPAGNVWNTPVTGLPVHPRSAQWLTASGAMAGRLLHPDFGAPPYGIPIDVVGAGHPARTLQFDDPGESDPGPYPYGSDLRIEGGGDAHQIVVDQSTCVLSEVYAMNENGPGTAGSGAKWNLRSDALRPAAWTSADAAGLPIMPGLVRVDEVEAGAIRHAIRFTVSRTDRSYLWPARHQAGAATDPTLPPMGARFRLMASFDVSRYGPDARAC